MSEYDKTPWHFLGVVKRCDHISRIVWFTVINPVLQILRTLSAHRSRSVKIPGDFLKISVIQKFDTTKKKPVRYQCKSKQVYQLLHKKIIFLFTRYFPCLALATPIDSLWVGNIFSHIYSLSVSCYSILGVVFLLLHQEIY